VAELLASTDSWNEFKSRQAPGFVANLTRAELGGAALADVDLRHADLRKANLCGTDLSTANLHDADFMGAVYDRKTTWPEGFSAKTVGAINLDDDLPGADLSRANLGGRDFSRANLSGLNAAGASFVGTRLIGANLRKVNLFQADLSGANLSGADLCGADLSEANLTGADLTGLHFDDVTVWPQGFIPTDGGAINLAEEDRSPTSEQGSFWSEDILHEFEEIISEEGASQLWEESAPLREIVQQVLDSQDGVPEDAAARARVHLDRLEAELNTVGGALGGSIRSYLVALIEFVNTHTIRPALADVDHPALEPLKEVLDDVGKALADPQLIGQVLNNVEEIASKVGAREEVRKAMLAAFKLAKPLADSLSDTAQEVSEGLSEHQGFTYLTGVASAGVIAVFAASGLAAASLAAGVATATFGTILIMTHRTYRSRYR